MEKNAMRNDKCLKLNRLQINISYWFIRVDWVILVKRNN